MNEIKENARRLLIAHGFADVAETIDALESPHGIRTLAVCRCAPATIDASKVGNIPSYAAGMFDLLVVQLNMTPDLNSYDPRKVVLKIGEGVDKRAI